MRRRCVLALAAVLAILAGVLPARADYLVHGAFPAGWGHVIVADDTPYVGIHFKGTSPTTQSGAADVVVATYWPGVSPTTPYEEGNFVNRGYELEVHVTDLDSLQSGVLTFNGFFSGYARNLTSVQAEMFNVSNVFAEPSTQSLTLGANLYQVTLPSFFQPDELDFFTRGEIKAHIEVSPAVAPVPEPSALLLGSVGLSALALFRRRRVLVAQN